MAWQGSATWLSFFHPVKMIITFNTYTLNGCRATVTYLCQ
jgi:hypothetical protein